MKVLLVDPIDPSGVNLLREKTEVLLCKEGSLDGIRRDAQDADAVITRSRLPDDFFDFAGQSGTDSMKDSMSTNKLCSSPCH